MLSRDEEVIIAQSTPTGTGALALLRLSGLNTREVLSKISYFPNKKHINELQSKTVNFGYIVDDEQNRVDQVMFIILDGPETFTGQNIIEITCHNNKFIIQKIISLAIKHGARYAENGEFTRRAVLNNKIDLIQAEAINELIHANTQLALKQALSQVQGSFSSWVNKLEKDLVKILAWCQATFEFLDEEVDFNDQIKDLMIKISQDIVNIKKMFDIQQHIKNGVRIALIGSVNAGKSSIFNMLLKQNRAIVTDIAGTTRDAIEAGITFNENYCTLIDTAGIRQTYDIVEQEGIKKSFEEAAKADIILLILDSSRKLSLKEENLYKDLFDQYFKKIILVANKSDLKNGSFKFDSLNSDLIEISAITKENFDQLELNIQLKIDSLFGLIESPFLLNQRHFNILTTLQEKIQIIINMFNNYSALHYELIAYNIGEVIEILSGLTGKSVSESGLDMVFKEFCVGK